jgi:hypothetical protein
VGQIFICFGILSGDVILGDGKTCVKIQGVGNIKHHIGDHILSVDGI